MPIIRGKLGLVDNFTQIPNSWLRDSNLSLKSIGLLAQLSSHEEGWKVTIQSLAKANGCGHDYIRGAVNELEEAGYLRREQRRRANNQFAEVVWVTQDPLSEKPLSEKPSSENPISENPTHKNNNSKNKILENTNIKYFALFWDLYPRKVGQAQAQKAFAKALGSNPKTIEAKAEVILNGVKELASDPNLPPMTYIPHPSTWLNRLGWLDDPYPPRDLSKEEQQAKDRERYQRQMQAERDHTAKVLAEMKSYERGEIVKCEHGKNLAMCVACSKQLANE